MGELMHDDDLFHGLAESESTTAEPGPAGGTFDPHEAFDDRDVEPDDEDEKPQLQASRRRVKGASSAQDGVTRVRESGASSRRGYGHYPLAEREVLRIGDVVGGKYRVDRVVGKRGAAMVVQATHVDLGQPVTIRHPSRDVSRRPNTIARFLRVARAACQIQSEHAARVLDVGRLDTGVPYLVTEGLSGWDVEEVLRVRGPLSVEDAVDYVVQASEAVAEAHSLGVIHRSLSLWNLILSRRPDGSALVKVLDFGVPDVPQAVPFSEIAVTETEANPLISALRFLSPEQVRNADDVDARADVWALGAILQELLTGAPAFYGASPGALLAAVAADPPRSTGAVLHPIPPEIEMVIDRSLAKDRAARFQSVAEFVQALRSFVPADSMRTVERISRMSLPSRPPPLPGSLPPVSLGPPSRAVFVPKGSAKKPAWSAPSPWLVTAGVAGALIGAIVAIGTERIHAPPSQAAAPPAIAAAKAAAPEVAAKPVAPPAASPTGAEEAAPPTPKASIPHATPTTTAFAAAPVRATPKPLAQAAATNASSPPPEQREHGTSAAKGSPPPTSAAKGGVASSSSPSKKDLFDDTR